MIIRELQLSDREDLFHIWKICFTEDDKYIDRFLSNCFPYSTSFAICDETNHPVSILSILPSFTIENEEISGGYLYGVATLPEFRNKGYSKQLIHHALSFCKQKRFSYLIVKPAEKSLFKFYQNLGFNLEILEGASISDDTISKRTKEDLFYKTGNISTKKISSEELFVARNRYAKQLFLHTKPILRYALAEIIHGGGLALEIEYNLKDKTNKFYILANNNPYKTQNKIQIVESSISSEEELIIAEIALKKENITIDYASSLLLFGEEVSRHSNSATILDKKTALVAILDNTKLINISQKRFSLPME